MDVIISKTKNKNIHLLTSDFSSLNQVRKLAGEITSKFNQLEVLINNAGVFMKERILTEDNYETTFVVNHLAHFLLTYLLMDMIKQSSPSRIIVVTSMVYSSSIDFGNLRGEKHFSGYDACAQKKLANIMFTYKLAYELGESGVTVNSLHLGVINTKLLRGGFGSTFALGLKAGVKVPVFLASSTKAINVIGKFFVTRLRSLGIREYQSSPIAYDKESQNKLWEVSSRLVKI